MTGTPLLDVRGISVSYGAIPALRDVSMHVGAGEIVAVIGPNGAGKTTLVRAICGLERLAAGDVRLAGQSVKAKRTEARVKAGLALVPQGRRVFAESTVRTNLWAGAFLRSDAGAVAADMERILTMFPNLRDRLDADAGVLSGGEQQMLALGRALMSRPRLLLLDEPSMGLAPVVVGRIFEALETLAQAGTTMLLVEQNVSRALQVAQRVYVLRSGEVIARDIDARAASVDALVARYLGVGPG